MAQSMVQKKNSNTFWGQVVATTTYILNHSPIKLVQTITPKEAWGSQKTFVAKLQVFGFCCMCMFQYKREIKGWMLNPNFISLSDIIVQVNDI